MFRKYFSHNSYILLYIFLIVFISLGQKIFIPLGPNNKNIELKVNQNIVGNISLNHTNSSINKNIVFSNTAKINNKKLFIEITLVSAKRKLDLKIEKIFPLFESNKNKFELNKNILKIREKDYFTFYKCFRDNNKINISRIDKIKSLFNFNKSSYYDCLLISSNNKKLLENLSYKKNTVQLKN